MVPQKLLLCHGLEIPGSRWWQAQAPDFGETDLVK